MKKSLGMFALTVCTMVLGQASLAFDDGSKDAQADPNATRFDLVVREDYFAGFNGDTQALERGMKASESVLKDNPKHAEAMVWLGGGQVFLSGQNFSKGNVVEGMKLWQTGLANMDKASELEPDNIGVLIPRAAVLMPASRNLPKPIREQVLNGVLANFLRVYEQQKNELDKIGEHPLGELRMGLADVYRSLGKADESKTQLEAILQELPDTEYSTEAKKWLEAKPTAKLAHNCIGCHSK
jgi:hypothetical protein